MIMKKETLVFITSLAIIFIIGYVNMTMSPDDVLNNDILNSKQENLFEQNELSVETKGEDVVDNAKNTEILGDITDITDITDVASIEASSNEVLDEASNNTQTFNISFENFKINKEKGNSDVIDRLEDSLSSSTVSEMTKEQFEQLLLNKNTYMEAEKNIELMLKTKGYNESLAVVDENTVKVISNDTLEKADVTKILDVVMAETNYKPAQIKIVKFDNIDL